MLSFHQVVKNDFDAVNQRILQELHSDVELVENIGQYLIDAGGKRLRPLLVLLSAKACGYQPDADREFNLQPHISMAAVIEFIHTATLLHDDVVDTSELRRGRATANAEWGNAPSVLVGDFLYSRAFQMLVALDSMTIMRIMADTTNIISEGEVQQLLNAGNADIDEDHYNEVIRKKTAQLFEAAAHTGAVLANAPEKTCEGLRRYGHHLGMAFQLVDDALDYRGDADNLGKNIGDDLAEGKPTLPLIMAMREGTAEQSALIKTAIEQGGLEQMAEIQSIIKATGAIEYTLERAQQQAALAKQQLDSCDALNAGPEVQTLFDLADFAVERNS